MRGEIDGMLEGVGGDVGVAKGRGQGGKGADAGLGTHWGVGVIVIVSVGLQTGTLDGGTGPVMGGGSGGEVPGGGVTVAVLPVAGLHTVSSSALVAGRARVCGLWWLACWCHGI